MEKEKWRNQKNGGNQCCLTDRAGPRGFSLMPAPPGRTQRAGFGLGTPDDFWAKFGEKRDSRGRLGGKSPAGVEKLVLGGSWGAAGVTLMFSALS